MEVPEFAVLGPIEVRDGGESLPLGGRAQRELLALLILHANRVVSSDRLLDELWPEHVPSSGRTALQNRVSQLRKALGPRIVIETQSPGYILRVDPGRVDLLRFERLVERTRHELRDGHAEKAAASARAALSLWRGEPLAGVSTDVLGAERARLDELRLAALALRIDADLACDRHEELVAELGVLVAEHPLSERFREQFMLSLYRSGRQADALSVYREGRGILVDELGVDPGPELQRLHKAILSHDAMLEQERPGRAARRSILLVGTEPEDFEGLLGVGEVLARTPGTPELIAVALQAPDDAESITRVNRILQEARLSLARSGTSLRAAALTSADPGTEIVRLAGVHQIDLILIAVDRSDLVADADRQALKTVAHRTPSDVALLPSREFTLGKGLPVTVPFGGGEHDWAALELGAWLAQALGATLKLVGVAADRSGGGEDASRLLASASLVVQALLPISVDAALIEPGPDSLVQATAHSALIVAGLPGRWLERGLGEPRLRLLEVKGPPVLFVRRGLRPGGLAPDETLTQFTWSLATKP